MDAFWGAEFPHLAGRQYLDYAGAPPVSACVARQAAEDLLRCGNPHSQHVLGRATSQLVDAARRQVVERLLPRNAAAEYTCVFTSGATAALKLVADCFPWSAESLFVGAADSHDSARGIGSVARSRGAVEAELDLASPAQKLAASAPPASGAHHLFTFPGENNVTGKRHNLRRWTRFGQRGHAVDGRGGEWHVCLDASKLAAGAKLELREGAKPDFIALSFYKLVGAPTGLGALLVRNDMIPLLAASKIYRGGGSLAAAAAHEAHNAVAAPVGAEAAKLLEDGTLPFQQIALLPTALQWLESLGGAAAVGQHAWSLRDFVAARLTAARHANGAPVCAVYGPPAGSSSKEVGGVVAFNVLTCGGRAVSCAEVGHAAAERGLDLRWGAFCNAGGLRRELLAAHGAAASASLSDPCWRPADGVAPAQRRSLAAPDGAVRASFGFASRFEDARALVEFVLDFAASRRGDEDEDDGGSCAVEEAPPQRCCPADDVAEQPQNCPRKCQKWRHWATVKKQRQSVPLPRFPPRLAAPGAPNALPRRCGNYEARRKAGRAYPNAMAAVRADSLPALCWHLHDLGHLNSVEEEFTYLVFGSDWQARTVLMAAAGKGRAEMVEVLIHVLGADVNHRSSSDGDTALHRAACTGRPHICTLLLEAGARSEFEVASGPLAGWRASRVASWKASGDRDAHEKAQSANYKPVGGCEFAEACSVLLAAEEDSARRAAEPEEHKRHWIRSLHRRAVPAMAAALLAALVVRFGGDDFATSAEANPMPWW